MILLWCLSGTAAAYCIGRYNQSNKLFWILFTSFVVGIAGAAVYNKYTQLTKENAQVTQITPTQNTSVTKIVTFDTELAMCENMPASVSKEKKIESYLNIVGHQWVKQPTCPPPRNS